MTTIVRRGEYAVLSVTHPILGTDLEVGAHTIRVGPEQYLALVDVLCRFAFLAPPHLAAEIGRVAGELDVPEVKQYVAWLREADRDNADKISVRGRVRNPDPGGGAL